MILLIDNYDSFTYNLYQYLGELGRKVKVIRNDQITLDEIKEMNPECIVISPGPGRPDSAGICLETITTFSGDIPLLGICLGHQSIGQAFGGEVTYAPELYHGKASMIQHDSKGVYQDLEKEVSVGRYHSLIVNRENLPDCFVVTSWTEDGLIMGIRHKEHKTEGIQFHPESILTPEGKQMLKNFVESL